MNISGVLARVFNRISADDALEIIKERLPSALPTKKPKKKSDIEETFLSLASIIRPEEIEDFVQMAVMKKMKGLPVYTYRVTDLNSVDHINVAKVNFPIEETYTVSVQVVENNNDELVLDFRVKEFTDMWKTGVKNTESLSAVYTAKVLLNKNNSVLSIYTGNYEVQRVIEKYLSLDIKWPISPYKLKVINNQIRANENASYKTSLVLDFVYNRLVSQGINANFREIKFSTGSKHRTKEGIKDVTINGQNLLSSQLACEYITFGSDIVYFKLDMMKNDEMFTGVFYLTGNKNDEMKIVIFDNESNVFKKIAIEQIQSEYIEMCNKGINDSKNTERMLDQVYTKYQNKDYLLNKSLQSNVLSSLGAITDLIEHVDEENEEVRILVGTILQSNKFLLDAVAFEGDSSELEKLRIFIGDADSDVEAEED